MLQREKPGDYVIATGQTHTVRRLLEVAFSHAGLNWRDHVEIDKELLRPAEVHHLRGDYSKAKEELGWEPAVSFEELIGMMVDSDLKSMTQNARSVPFAAR